MDRLTPRLPLLFVLAVMAHAVFAVVLGQPAPAGRFQDVNVYLDLAQNLWRDGTYISLVNERPYPPGYPFLLAPTFAVDSNAARFALTYAMHALLLGAASLLLLPMLRDALGRRSAWMGLIALQAIAGSSFTLLHAQSEALYTPLLVALTGAIYLAWRDDRVSWGLLAGCLAGLALSTRRLGIVAPIALLLVVGHDLLAARRAGRPTPWRRTLAFGLGAVFGVMPDVLGALLAGNVINAYPTYTSTYAQAGGAAFVSPSNASYALSTASNQLAYYVLITLGAPVTMAALLWTRWRRPMETDGDTAPLATQRTMQWVGYAALGSAALTTLHIVRHVFKTSPKEGFSTYPRYLDPLEIPLVVCGVLAAAALSSPDLRERASRLVGRFAVLAAGFAVLSGPWYRTRAGRLLPLRRFEQVGVGPLGLAFFALISFVVLGIFWWLWTSGRAGTLAGILVAVALSWTLSLHVPIRWMSSGLTGRPPAPVLLTPEINADPTAPLCVVVDRRSRRYYELAFRSEHPAWFVTRRGASACAAEHPTGWIVARLDSSFRPARYKVTLPKGSQVVKAGRYKAWPLSESTVVGKEPKK